MTAPTPEQLKIGFLSRLQEELALVRQASDATASDRKPVILDQLEDLDLSGPGPLLATASCITAEPLGSETLYNIDIAGTACRVLRRETSVSLPEGQTARVHLRPGARLHLFDADGTRIGGAVLGQEQGGTSWTPEEHG